MSANWKIVSQPEINVEQIEKGKPFIFTAEVATKPEVTLGEYKGLEVDKVSVRVTQKEVDAKIQKRRRRTRERSPWKTVRYRIRMRSSWILKVSWTGKAFEGGKGENYPLTIGFRAPSSLVLRNSSSERSRRRRSK